MIDVPRLGQADHRVDEQAAVNLSRGSFGDLFVDPVHRVPGLEGDDLGIAHLTQHGAHLSRRAPEVCEVKIAGQIDDLKLARDAEIAPADHFGDQRVAGIGAAQDQLGFLFRIPGEDLFNVHHCKQVVAGVPESDLVDARGQQIMVDSEGDWDGEERAVDQPHLGHHAFIVVLAHKTIQGRKRARCEQLQVVQITGRDLDGRQVRRQFDKLFARFTSDDPVDQFSAVGRDQGSFDRLIRHE